MYNVNTIAIVSTAREAFRLGDAFMHKVASLTNELRGLTLEQAQSHLTHAACDEYGLVPSVTKAGKYRFDSKANDAQAVNNATKRIERLLAAIYGKPSKREEKPEIEVPEHIQALADKLAKACAEYKESRKLAATAVATAFAKV